MSEMKTVFLSSTGRDLSAYRDTAYEAVEGLDGYHCVRMEDFGARNWGADGFDRAKVGECDVFVGILGHCYGSCPEGTEQSFTEREYEAAIAANLPRLMFLAPEDFPLPASLIEPDEKRVRQHAFRERVSAERIRDTFTSPEDLARRVVSAIRNWEQEWLKESEARETDGTQAFLPLPPQPYFAHPYPMQENFTGRLGERRMLTAWLAGGPQPVFVLVAIGGMGKSALTWAWLQRDVLGLPLPGIPDERLDVTERPVLPDAARPEGVLWWSFYEREARFANFLDAALSYASGGGLDPNDIPSSHDKVTALVGCLEKKSLLFVLDGFERELRAYASLNAAYQGDEVVQDERGDFRACTDPHAADFLRRIAALPLQGRVLLTSRLFPRELDGLAGSRREDLAALDPDDAVAFFRAQGVRGTRAEIQAACEPYGYHPLALRLLGGVIVTDKKKPGDIGVADRHPVLPELKGKERHHILQVAYDALDKKKRRLLSEIAAFRNPMTYDALQVVNRYKTERQFDAALDELLERGLMFFDRERAHYDLHPVVRQYAYDRLGDKEGVHTRLRDYFAAVPKPDKATIESLDDLAPVIELYHHTVRAGRYDDACDLYQDRLSTPLYFGFGAYQTCIELLRSLFPDGETHPPRMKSARDQAWTSNELANSYSLSGQPRRAMPLYERGLEIDEKRDDKLNVAITLETVATGVFFPLGMLAKSVANHQRKIELCREKGDEFEETVGHVELGRSMAFIGETNESANQLDAALASFTNLKDQGGECLVWAYRAERAMLMNDWRAALAAAQEAHKIAAGRQNERDRIRTEWLLGEALIGQASERKRQQPALPNEAEAHLTEALTRCRRINAVEQEPQILLAWARWHRLAEATERAREYARDALTIADRCEYRLIQADIHNFLAQLALDEGERESGQAHAEIAHERALCDGPPHCYKPALDEAGRLLNELRGS